MAIASSSNECLCGADDNLDLPRLDIVCPKHDGKPARFRSLVKAAHDAIDEYAEARLSNQCDWFAEDLDGVMLRAVRAVSSFGRRERTPEEWREANERMRG